MPPSVAPSQTWTDPNRDATLDPILDATLDPILDPIDNFDNLKGLSLHDCLAVDTSPHHTIPQLLAPSDTVFHDYSESSHPQVGSPTDRRSRSGSFVHRSSMGGMRHSPYSSPFSNQILLSPSRTKFDPSSSRQGNQRRHQTSRSPALNANREDLNADVNFGSSPSVLLSGGVSAATVNSPTKAIVGSERGSQASELRRKNKVKAWCDFEGAKCLRRPFTTQQGYRSECSC